MKSTKHCCCRGLHVAGAVALGNLHHFSVLVALLRWTVAEPGGTWVANLLLIFYSDYDTTIFHLSISCLL
jgi:hypothetical protein